MENFIKKHETKRKSDMRFLAIIGYIILIPPTLWVAWNFMIKITLHHVFGMDISFTTFW